MPRYVDLSKMPQLEAWGCCCEGENYAFVPFADVIQALRQAEAQTGEVEPVKALLREKKRRIEE